MKAVRVHEFGGLDWGLVAYAALTLAGRRRKAGPAKRAEAGGGS